MAKRILRPEDQITREDYMAQRRNYTEEDARRLGYLSLELMHMEDRLTELAGQWRSTKDDALVMQYHNLLYQMVLQGFDVDDLDVIDLLPEALMPKLPPRAVMVAIKDAYKALQDEKQSA